MKLRKLVLAFVGAATIAPAIASAQPFEGDGRYGPPHPTREFGYASYGDPLGDRVARVRDWMRHGSQEGWLDGWRARRAWGEFRIIADESRGDSFARRDAWRRLDHLTNYLRWAHENGEE